MTVRILTAKMQRRGEDSDRVDLLLNFLAPPRLRGEINLILNSPEEALDCFLRTQMDMLVLENCVIER